MLSTIRPFQRFPVQCLWIIIALLLAYNSAHAGICIPPDVHKESAYHYILSFTDALSYAKEALDRFSKNRDSPSSNLEWFLALKLGKADFKCAESQVSPYVASSGETIRISATQAAMVFANLAALQEEAAGQSRVLLNSIGKEVERGTILEKQAELAASYDETWKLLPMVASASTYAVVEKDPTTGLMSGLALTTKQRDKILQNLRSTFGDEVTNGLKAGQHSLVAAAAVLYEVIGNQPRKTRDGK